MTDSQIRSIKRGQEVRDFEGRAWVAQHDAFVPPRDTVNAQVAVRREAFVRILTHHATDF